MREDAARTLNEINKRFYESQAGAFSATRNNSWRGWRQALDAADLPGCAEHLDVLDVACGNLRFEAWASDAYPEIDLRFTAVDICPALLPDALPGNVRFVERDVIASLLDSDKLETFGDARYDVAVSFGFMHHIPGLAARTALLDGLVAAVRPGGHVVASFWRFADDEGLRARAETSTADALSRGCVGSVELDEGDYLLGFGEESADVRYCHSFSDVDIAAVLDGLTVPCALLARFRADGRTNALNEYVVLRRGDGTPAPR